MRRTKGLRYAAMRKAQQAKQERDAKRLRRERQVEVALAEYFEQVAVIDVIETATAAKVALLTAAAVTAVGHQQVAAAAAVQAMLDLGETRTAVAELTGLTLTGVRDLLTNAGRSLRMEPANAGDVEPAGAPAPAPDEREPWPDDADDAPMHEPASAYLEPADTEPPYTEPPYTKPPYTERDFTQAAYPVVVSVVPENAEWLGSPDWARPPDRSGGAWTT
jgi:hypothetical protein